jgi:ABC-type multidrug transport system ATPase subunit
VLVARGARLWLLDEPHAGLDQDGRDLLDGLLAGSRAAGRTVVFASHELERASVIADRSIHLAGGRVVASPEPAETPEPAERPGPVKQAHAHVA